MRILHINKFHYLRGGAEKYFFDVMELFENKGHEVIPFCMKDRRNTPSKYDEYFASNISFDPPNLMTVLKAGRIIYSPNARKQLTKLVKDTKPDVAHVHLMYHQLSPSVLLALKELGIPTVMTIHDWQPLSPNYSFGVPGHVYTVEEGKQYWRIVRERAIKNSYLMSALAALAATIHHKLRWYEDTVDRYIAPSMFVKDMFTKSGWREDQLVHIPHFASHMPKASRKKKEPYILFAGRLSWEKGIHTLVKYWCEHKIPYTLKVAGRGGLERQLRRIIDQYQAEDRIELLGFVDPVDLEPMMQQAAALILPSVFYETFGLVVTEAWAAGTGVIAHDIGPFPEMVGKSGAGELFSWEKGDLAQVVKKYMKDEKKWATYGKKGRNLVKERYSAEGHYKALMKVYTSICA